MNTRGMTNSEVPQLPQVPAIRDHVTYHDHPGSADSYLRTGVVRQVIVTNDGDTILVLAHPAVEEIRWSEFWRPEHMDVTTPQV